MAEFVKDRHGSWCGIRLASGRVISLNHGLLSVNPDFEMGDGYDSPVSYTRHAPETSEYVSDYTPDEVAEIADAQITLWQAVKARGSWTDWG